ncbi:hypothetical protein ACIBCB_27345 [Streptomyces uncialis]|uniref:hypothetical protein n=1 Tax=Streptomyces uncialis TaxID=1048205 RepID=UPI0037B955FE
MVKQLDTDGTGLERGAVVFDSERRKVGEYQDESGPYAELRAANERSERRP